MAPAAERPLSEVAVRGVGKVYGRQRALATVDVTLRSGDCALLLGPNGAGKSTLLGILSTLVRPSTGELRFDGEPMLARHRGDIGVIAHEPLVYGDLTGRENLRFFARLHGVSDGKRVDELLERVELREAASRLSRTYSRGMLQRLAVARMLLHRPRLLLLDEPFTGLDAAGCTMLAAILDEERRAGAMLLVATHDLASLSGPATRALVLRRGRLIHDGAPPDAAGLRELLSSTAPSPSALSPSQAPSQAPSQNLSPEPSRPPREGSS